MHFDHLNKWLTNVLTALQNCSSDLAMPQPQFSLSPSNCWLCSLLTASGHSWRKSQLCWWFLRVICLRLPRGPRTASIIFFFLLWAIFSFSLVTFHSLNPNPLVLSKQPYFLIKKTKFQAADKISPLPSPRSSPTLLENLTTTSSILSLVTLMIMRYDTECHTVTPALTHPRVLDSYLTSCWNYLLWCLTKTQSHQ